MYVYHKYHKMLYRIDDFVYSDFVLDGYEPWAAIPAQVAK